MSGRFRTVAVIAAAMFVLAPAAEAAAETLAQITARLPHVGAVRRSGGQGDTPAQKTAITNAINDARHEEADRARGGPLAGSPSDAPGATAGTPGCARA